MTAECRQYREKLSEYLDGELAEAARTAFEAHLAGCVECRHELQALRLTLGAVASLPACKAPPRLAEGVLARLAAGRAKRPAVLTVLWTRALPVAAMLAVVVGLLLTLPGGGPARPAPQERLAMARLKVARPPSVTAAAAEPAVALADRSGLAAGAALAEDRAAGVSAEAAAEQEVLEKELLKRDQGAARAVALRAAARGASEKVKFGDDMKAVSAPAVALRSSAAGGRAGEEGALPTGAGYGMAQAPASALTWAPADEAAVARAAAGNAGVALMFAQTAPGPQVPGPVHQVLTVPAEDPADLARQVVLLANGTGVPAVLSLEKADGKGAIEVLLRVPGKLYGDLLARVSGLAPAPRQTLANTAVAATGFFRQALDDYDSLLAGRSLEEAARLRTALPLAEGPQRAAGMAARTRDAPAAAVAAEVGRVAGPAPPAEEPPAVVNLLVRVTQAR
jgi:predicted anti-sigma-YlaC factor YlaD